MVDPLTIATSAIALAGASRKIVLLCYEYLGKTISSRRDVIQIINSVSGLTIILEHLHTLVRSIQSPSSLFDELAAPHGPLQKCQTALQVVEHRLASDGGRHTLRHALTWPLRSHEIYHWTHLRRGLRA
jgi:hypothetical protein